MAIRPKRLVSSRFPYLPLTVEVRQWKEDIEAFLDTGFDGDIVLPSDLIRNGEPPDRYLPWKLADGSEVITPAYVGTVSLGQLGRFPAVIIVLGDEALAGRGLVDRFSITFDHGKHVIVKL